MNPRMVLFEEDQKRLAEACEKLARDALAKAIFLLDTNGQIVVATGEVASIDQTSLASLVAGTTAATTSLAKLLGEAEFPVHFHEGKHTHLHISLVGENHILTVWPAGEGGKLVGEDIFFGSAPGYRRIA